MDDPRWHKRALPLLTRALDHRGGHAALAGGAALGLSILMTWPLASGFGRLGRTRSDDADGLYAIWNVSWVARTLVENPLALFDANIFHPHRWTLAYSELNLVGGIVGIPGWLLTANPYVTLNSALLFAFSTSAFGAWLLARHLSDSSAAAAVAGVVYGFCPYFFSHTAHIQLLMGGGIPLALLMLHRLADDPSVRRGVWLGLALAVQALACAYYGIFAGLIVAYGSVFLAISRGLWRRRAYWVAVAAGAAVSVVCVLPFFIPFIGIQEGGFHRTLQESRLYSANMASYLASSAHAHRWLLDVARSLGRWNEVLFPGFVAIALGSAGLLVGAIAPRASSASAAVTIRDRETVALYGSIGVLALWASAGPAAGLYTVLFEALPLFSFLRAPSRAGVIVPLALGVLAALALARVPARAKTAVSIGALAIALLELQILPFPWAHAPALPRPYVMLAQLPRGPLAEFPFYGSRSAFHLHTQYMLFSTFHWFPMVNGYSDHMPPAFRQTAFVLDSFPSTDSFAVLRRHRVRYIGVHWNMFGPRAEEIRSRLTPFLRHLRTVASDDGMTLYEVVTFP